MQGVQLYLHSMDIEKFAHKLARKVFKLAAGNFSRAQHET
jgi:hypothetical protein